MKKIKQQGFQKLLTSRRWHTSYSGVIFIALMICIVYFPCIQNDFIWDDVTNIYENSCLNKPGGLLRIWGSFDLYQYYPLTFTSFYIEHKLWGFNPVGYHITNILLHTFNVILIFFLLQQLGLKRPLAFFTAALFAIHPIEAESVAWATERKNLLSGVFYFSSFLSYLKFLDTEKYRFYGLSLFFFIAALLSKSATVTLPLTLIMAEYLRGKSINRSSLFRISVFFVLGIVMGLITIYLEATRAGAAGEEWSLSILQRIIITSRVMLFYASKIVLPANMCFIYPQWQIDPSLSWDYWPVILLTGLGTLLWWFRKRINPIIWFSLGHYVVSLLPASGMINFYFMRYSFVQNHFQYIAGLGIMILIGTIGIGFIRRVTEDSIQLKISVLLASVVLIGCGFMTHNQCKIYRDNKTLWYDTISKNPDAWMAYLNLGNILIKQGKTDEGIEYLKKALTINPDNKEAHNSLGLVYYVKGRLDEAIAEYNRALTIKPNYIKARSNLGAAYSNKGMLDEAISEYKKVLAIKPNHAAVYSNLGTAYFKKGMLDEAISEYKKALAINFNLVEAHHSLGIAYSKKGMLDESISAYKRALTIKPNHAAVHINLGVAYGRKGMLDEAISELKKTLTIKPNHAEAHNNLSVAYYHKGNYKLAIVHFDKAVELGYSVNPKLFELLEPYR